jgi:hypothetical protein
MNYFEPVRPRANHPGQLGWNPNRVARSALDQRNHHQNSQCFQRAKELSVRSLSVCSLVMHSLSVCSLVMHSLSVCSLVMHSLKAW